MLGADDYVAQWVAQRIGGLSLHDMVPFSAIGVEAEGQLIAGAVFNIWQPSFGSIHLTLAATNKHWLNRRIIRALLSYPFSQIGCQRVTALIAKKNKRVRKEAERFGFVMEGVMRKGFGSQDCVIYGLLKDDIKHWLGDH